MSVSSIMSGQIVPGDGRSCAWGVLSRQNPLQKAGQIIRMMVYVGGMGRLRRHMHGAHPHRMRPIRKHSPDAYVWPEGESAGPQSF